MLPKKSVMITYSIKLMAMPSQIASPTEPAPSVKTGFIKALKQVMCINVTPFLQTKFNLSSDLIRRNLYATA